MCALSAAVFWAIFVDYLPPFKSIQIPYDLQSYHYPLMNYAFLSLKEGRFPFWDPAIYCGLSFVGNVQSTLFYPPTWLLFAADFGRDRLSYTHLEILQLVHVWAGFMLCFLWLELLSKVVDGVRRRGPELTLHP